MNRIYLPSQGAEDWRRLLADPAKQWRAGFSAMSLARCWEAADGLPPEVGQMLREIGPHPELMLAVPEHKVPLPGSWRGASQNDLFALVRAGDRTVAVTVEGKVDEPFAMQIGDWLKNASPGKRTRLEFLCSLLGLDGQKVPRDVHYQLLHRTASAIIEARRFKTDAAAMIVHSFSQSQMWFGAFARFVELFGCTAEPGKLIEVRPGALPPFYLGWATGSARFLRAIEPSSLVKGTTSEAQIKASVLNLVDRTSV